MGREELESTVSRWIEQNCVDYSTKEFGEGRFFTDNTLPALFDALIDKLPAPAHPVEGELTDWETKYKRMVNRWMEDNDKWIQARTKTRKEHEAAVEKMTATIDALNAKMETSVQIPPVEEWPKNASCICVGFVAGTLDHWVNRDKEDWSTISVIPRPTPKTMTNEEKAEAVMRAWGYRIENTEGRHEGERKLMYAMLDGRSIDDLYAEVAKGGEK